MNISFVDIHGCDRLLLIFAGWGMDSKPFAHLTREDYDLAVAWGYTTDKITAETEEQLQTYGQICIIAWSFGVVHAMQFIESHAYLPVTMRVAVNGTLVPVDDELGIPLAVFQGTLDNLTDRSLLKFYRRMCGSSTAFEAFKQVLPERNLEDLRDELVRMAAIGCSTDRRVWNRVYVSDSDAIIPTDNQLHFWRDVRDLRRIPGAHLPNFQTIIDESVVNKAEVCRRFTGSRESYDIYAQVQREMAQKLSGMLQSESEGRGALQILEVGAGTGLLTRMNLDFVDSERLILWDLAPMPENLPGLKTECDAESAIRNLPDESMDVIISSSAVQWFDSIGDFVEQCHRVLRPGGLFLIATFGPATYKEIPHPQRFVERFADASTWREYTGCFADADISESLHTMQFADTRALLRHIKSTGVNVSPADAVSGVRTALEMIRRGVKELTYQSIFVTAHK